MIEYRMFSKYPIYSVIIFFSKNFVLYLNYEYVLFVLIVYKSFYFFILKGSKTLLEKTI